MRSETIIAQTRSIRSGLPAGVALVAAAKTRTPVEVMAAIAGGIDAVGFNYVQEGLRVHAGLVAGFGEAFTGRKLPFHLIGPLQANKIGKALTLFSAIETVADAATAAAIDQRAQTAVAVLIQVNIGGEAAKSGAVPETVPALAAALRELTRLRLRGLMVIEPFVEDPDGARPHFRAMRRLFEAVREQEGAGIAVLSMGMSHNYRAAVDEGATEVRIGTALFGPRP
ncbi:MAG: YggS family pyridoxal phosphate-dependent enzyme [Planctomycetota bacterium]